MAKRSTPFDLRDLVMFPPPNSAAGQQYYYITQRPWPSLLFILPGLLLFEVGTYLRGGSQLVAPYLIMRLVDGLRTGGDMPYLLAMAPGLLLVAILLAWHITARHPWRFDLSVLAGMLGESLVWTVPLLSLWLVMSNGVLMTAATSRAEWTDRIIRSFGAGIYEELVFRLICITLLVILLVDLLRLPRGLLALFIIMAGSAVLFAGQHHPPLGDEPFEVRHFAFRAGAGLYLAGLFVFRGFGIAAGCHAFYNIIVVTIGAIQD